MGGIWFVALKFYHLYFRVETPPSSSSLQMLYFSFNERPQEMFDRVVEIKVLNAKKVIRDALIGSFKVDTHIHLVCMLTAYIRT